MMACKTVRSCCGRFYVRSYKCANEHRFRYSIQRKRNFVGASIARPQRLDDFLHRATHGRPYKMQYICAFFKMAHLLFGEK